MKKSLVLILVLAAATLMAQSGAAHNAFTPDQVSWGPAPPFVPAGAQQRTGLGRDFRAT